MPYSHPKPVARKKVVIAALPMTLEEQPVAHEEPSRVTLLPFALHDVRLEQATRFGDAQRTNVAFLRLLDPDRLLYFFRRLARLPQPRADLTPYGGWESEGSGPEGGRGELGVSARCAARGAGRDHKHLALRGAEDDLALRRYCWVVP